MGMMNYIKLSELTVSLESGSRPKGGVSSDGIPSIGGEHIKSDGTFKFDNMKYVPEDFFHNLKKGVIDRGDILIVKDGATTGKVAFVDNTFPYKNAAINEHVFKLKINNEMVLPKYVFYYLYSRDGNRQLMKDFRGATVGGITKNFLNLVQIPIPRKLEFQNKIVTLLDKSQELIDKRKAQIEALDQLTQSVFLEMFGDPVKNSLGFKTEPLHELCIHIFGGGTPSKSNPEYYIGNIPWVTPKDMKDIVINDSIDHINEDAIANSSAKLIPPNSLLMVIRSGILKKKLPIAINTREVTVNQDMKAFVVDKNKITVEYLLYFFEFYQKVLLNRVRSVTADNFDFQQIKEILVPVPPINKQKEFSNIFYKVLAEKNKYLQQLNELEKNFHSLMQRAFKGELFNEQ